VRTTALPATQNSSKILNFFGIRLVFIITAMADEAKNEPRYPIGTVAQRLGVSVETIRLYERRGLILVAKSAGNQRLYSDSDVERLRCIRTAINDHKISIEGIRRIQSFVPCWEHVKCSEEQRLVCPAYHRSDAGCWTYKHKENECAGRNCRDCFVYQQSGDCNNIKSLVHNTSTPILQTATQQGT